MNIEIKKLTPDLCVTWRSDDSYVGENNHWYPTREERRKRAIQFVKAGSIQGYLAYHGGRIVGWCNANADCQSGVNHLRSYWAIEEYHADVKVKSVFCFVIAPEVQRMGVATKLLERVCKDAADDGYDFVEGYVNEKFTGSVHDFRGPLTMYEKCGFIRQAERGGRVVVRKALK